jgi:hypothetical protein
VRLTGRREDGEDVAPEEARVWIRDDHLVVHSVRRLTPNGAIGGGWSFLNAGETFSAGGATFVFELDEGSLPERDQARGDEPHEIPNILRDRPGGQPERRPDSWERSEPGHERMWGRADEATSEPPPDSGEQPPQQLRPAAGWEGMWRPSRESQEPAPNPQSEPPQDQAPPASPWATGPAQQAPAEGGPFSAWRRTTDISPVDPPRNPFSGDRSAAPDLEAKETGDGPLSGEERDDAL